MLAGVDEVEWSKLQACRDSGQIPAQLRAIADESPDVAQAAAAALADNISYQGSVFEATAVAVPFIGELIGSDVDRTSRLSLIGTLIQLGHGQTFVEPSLWGSTLDRATFQDRVAIESQYVRATQEAVAREVDVLLGRLPLDDPLLERAALAVAHCASEIPPAVMAELERIAAGGSQIERHRRQIALALARGDDVSFHWTSIYELTTPSESLRRLADDIRRGVFPRRGQVDIDIDAPDRDMAHCLRRHGTGFTVFFSRSGQRVAETPEVDEETACEEIRRRSSADPRDDSTPRTFRSTALACLFALGYVADDLDLHGERLRSADERPLAAQYCAWAWELDHHSRAHDFRAAEDPSLMNPVARWVIANRRIGEIEPWRLVTLDLVEHELRHVLELPPAPRSREAASDMRDDALHEMATILASG